MSRKAKSINYYEDDFKILEEWASSGKQEARLVERARIILKYVQTNSVTKVAQELRVGHNTVIKWRDRFNEDGIIGLFDQPRIGKPRVYGDKFRLKVLKTLELPPPKGQAKWDGPAVAKHLKASVHAVWRILRKEGISLSRQRSWCISTDPDFSAKAADIVGLYLNPPKNALVVSVDEKPSIQALERATGYVETDNGIIVRGYQSTYKRNGTLNLFAALEVATGVVRTQITERKRRVEFIEFMDKLVNELPSAKEIHVILDNYCIHKKNEAWLAKHPHVQFHFTPTSASWLNQVEIWFGIFSRKALRGASFKCTKDLAKAINEFVEVYNPNAKPFVWRKREVKGAQLRNTIANLRN